MEFSFNELSLKDFFVDDKGFKQVIDRVMDIRQLLKRLDRDLYCRDDIVATLLADGKNIYQAINAWNIERKQALLVWLNKKGPFLEDIRELSKGDMKYKDLDVTDSAVGEVAFFCFHGLDWRLVSLVPSSWGFSPIPIDWHKTGDEKTSIDVLNYWTIDQLRDTLDANSQTIGSWEDLKQFAYGRYSSITFLSECFEGLRGLPFMLSQSKKILMLLKILDDMKNCFDRSGKRTDEGHRIHRNYFEGDRAWFVPSSDTEQSKFEEILKFPHPDRKDEKLFCHWHGRVNSPHVPIRIHFSWPIRADEPLYVVYVGPKLTMD